MNKQEYDLIVVGSGPGGKHAAIAAAHLGKRVGIIERKPRLGGVSLQTGTIPSKALREAAYLYSRFSGRGMRSALSQQKINTSEFFQEAMQAKDGIIDRQEAVLLNQIMRNGISIIPGHAAFKDPHTLEVVSANKSVDLLQAEHVILATGSRPRRPDMIPFDRERVLDSTSILYQKRIPESIVVVGGGVIACEFATMLAALNVKTTIIDSHEQLLSYLDADIVALLEESMLDMGITLHKSTRVAGVTRDGNSISVKTSDDKEFTASHLLYAMGRIPNFDVLALENAGVNIEPEGWIKVNETWQTNVEHIYVIGDLAGRPSLAATAMEQARVAVAHAYQQKYVASHAPLPMAIYTIPELSYVGATEKDLKDQGIDYAVGYSEYTETARGQIIGANKGQMKLLARCDNRALLGVHIIGEAASELIHVGQMAMGYQGTVDDLASNVYNYPTLAETYKSAALDCLNKLHDKC